MKLQTELSLLAKVHKEELTRVRAEHEKERSQLDSKIVHQDEQYRQLQRVNNQMATQIDELNVVILRYKDIEVQLQAAQRAEEAERDEKNQL
jgi:hypothetical protein